MKRRSLLGIVGSFLFMGSTALASSPQSDTLHKKEEALTSASGESAQALKAKEKQKEVTHVPPPPPLSPIDAYARKVTGPSGKALAKFDMSKILPPEPAHQEPAEIEACKERLQARYKECLAEAKTYDFNGEKKCAAFKQWFKGRCVL
ncbi:MAG: hypothetical protein ACK5TR_04815 [Alphaproteobacteria bacterium]|jgi:hypothetical protein|nr:hypothetical protein [Alphaproteobacteria bacterium]